MQPNRSNWPIAAAMIPFPGTLPDGSLVQNASAEQWAATLAEVVDAGFTELDPNRQLTARGRPVVGAARRVSGANFHNAWRRHGSWEISTLARSMGLTVPAISTSRRNLIDPELGDGYVGPRRRFLAHAWLSDWCV